jgi:hypothetical protein
VKCVDGTFLYRSEDGLMVFYPSGRRELLGQLYARLRLALAHRHVWGFARMRARRAESEVMQVERCARCGMVRLSPMPMALAASEAPTG